MGVLPAGSACSHCLQSLHSQNNPAATPQAVLMSHSCGTEEGQRKCQEQKIRGLTQRLTAPGVTALPPSSRPLAFLPCVHRDTQRPHLGTCPPGAQSAISATVRAFLSSDSCPTHVHASSRQPPPPAPPGSTTPFHTAEGPSLGLFCMTSG